MPSDIGDRSHGARRASVAVAAAADAVAVTSLSPVLTKAVTSLYPAPSTSIAIGTGQNSIPKWAGAWSEKAATERFCEDRDETLGPVEFLIGRASTRSKKTCNGRALRGPNVARATNFHNLFSVMVTAPKHTQASSTEFDPAY